VGRETKGPIPSFEAATSLATQGWKSARSIAFWPWALNWPEAPCNDPRRGPDLFSAGHLRQGSVRRIEGGGNLPLLMGQRHESRFVR
jgi:hypothetical protein